MNRDSLIIEYTIGPVQVHMVRMPGVFDEGFSAQARAFQAFCDYETERVAADHIARTGEVDHWFRATSEREWATELEINGKFMSPLPATIEHASIWDFFKAINYNPKS